jgi:hypothetical protein
MMAFSAAFCVDSDTKSPPCGGLLAVQQTDGKPSVQGADQ